MDVIRTIGHVDEDGSLTLDARVELEPGDYRVTLVKDGNGGPEAPAEIESLWLPTYVSRLTTPGSTLGRDEIYADEV
jgi:hypothetical protein